MQGAAATGLVMLHGGQYFSWKKQKQKDGQQVVMQCRHDGAAMTNMINWGLVGINEPT
jgi:hypothetical protein